MGSTSIHVCENKVNNDAKSPVYFKSFNAVFVTTKLVQCLPFRASGFDSSTRLTILAGNNDSRSDSSLKANLQCKSAMIQ